MPVKIREEIFTKLATAIRQAGEKSSKAESSANDSRILESNIRAAEARVTSAEAQVERHQTAKRDIEDKLSPPPTKQVQGDGKKAGTKTVVDEQEKDKLTAQVRATDVQIQQAQATVELAKEEAEKLKSQTLTSIGISEENQRAMSQLSSQITELKTLANDPQTDLASEQFQTKLQTAATNTESLKNNLPDTANPALKVFWDEVKAGFTDVQAKLIQASTPARATVRKSGVDYSGFFEDVDQGFNTIINHLERTGGTREQIMNLSNAHDSIKNERNNYLGGMTTGDDNILADFLTNMNVIVNDINNGDTVEQASLNSLTQGASRAADKLSKNGTNFDQSIIRPTFSGITQNLIRIQSSVPNDEGFNSLMQNFDKLLENNTNKLWGFSKDDFNELDNFYESVRSVKDKAVNGTINSGDVRRITTLGNTTLNRLVTKFNLSLGSGNGSSNNGSGGTTNR
jgi:hypothetical protein